MFIHKKSLSHKEVRKALLYLSLIHICKVHMQVEYDGNNYYGFAANTDIIAASVEAFIDAINKFVK